jgi:hypothetical protein
VSILDETQRRIYVAASSATSQRARVRAFHDAVVEQGWVHSHPWLDRLEQVEAAGEKPTDGVIARCAYEDYLGVMFAHVFVFLVPPVGFRTNATAEFGMALGLGVPKIMLVGAPADVDAEFFSYLRLLPDAAFANIITVSTDAEALSVLQYARESSLKFASMMGKLFNTLTPREQELATRLNKGESR